MPFGDWQFWVATLVVVLIMAGIVRAFWPKKKGEHKASLTINKDCTH